jgi:hypothetical protein
VFADCNAKFSHLIRISMVWSVALKDEHMLKHKLGIIVGVPL